MKIAVAAALFASAAALLAGPSNAACSIDRVDLVTAQGTVSYRVEIADEPEERARGLMFRQSMDADAGMLFLFEQPGPASFWMRNTFIPLDIIFVDESGTVLNVAANTVPFSEARINSEGDAFAVLEINAGQAAEQGIAAGTQLRHPGFADRPGALPCD